MDGVQGLLVGEQVFGVGDEEVLEVPFVEGVVPSVGFVGDCHGYVCDPGEVGAEYKLDEVGVLGVL